jgi:hypothetical protein
MADTPTAFVWTKCYAASVELQPACSRYPQTVPEYQKEKTTVAGLVAAVLGRLNKTLYLKGEEMLALAGVEQRVAGSTSLAIPRPTGVPVTSWWIGLARKFGNTGGGMYGRFSAYRCVEVPNYGA